MMNYKKIKQQIAYDKEKEEKKKAGKGIGSRKKGSRISVNNAQSQENSKPADHKTVLRAALEGVQEPTASEYVTIKEGAERYRMSTKTFRLLAQEAHAVYKIRSKCIVSVKIFEEYLEQHRV